MTQKRKPKDASPQAVDVDLLRSQCSHCSLTELCLPRGVSAETLAKLPLRVDQVRVLNAGEFLLRASEPFRSVYAVRRGAFKSVLGRVDGVEQITGFHLPGELLGFDGFGSSTHACDVVALERAEACEVRANDLAGLCNELPELRMELLRLAGRQLNSGQKALLLLTHMTAEQRLASFVVDLAARQRRFGEGDDRLRLPMSRADLARYLGLALATVSRLLSRLHAAKVLSVQRRFIRVIDEQALRALASPAAGLEVRVPAPE